ncbi:MAG: hypothetical protein BJ554DRAFT_1794 [Olpidium bornovanus]|uniref:Uncharacterized protein n=1 Tax=Olpidium bornovanus TaxID=278681 RepID=A0A8H8DGX4_9FUNG|nr:MAG: hypothetical protein BJ554DRAFT_1794 [Olpidium bornovanus]
MGEGQDQQHGARTGSEEAAVACRKGQAADEAGEAPRTPPMARRRPGRCSSAPASPQDRDQLRRLPGRSDLPNGTQRTFLVILGDSPAFTVVAGAAVIFVRFVGSPLVPVAAFACRLNALDRLATVFV